MPKMMANWFHATRLPRTLARRDFRNVHGRQHRSQPHADAAQDAVKDKIPHVSRAAVADRRKGKLRRGRAQRGKQEQHRGDDQSALAADARADPAADQPADDAADQRA